MSQLRRQERRRRLRGGRPLWCRSARRRRCKQRCTSRKRRRDFWPLERNRNEPRISQSRICILQHAPLERIGRECSTSTPTLVRTQVRTKLGSTVVATPRLEEEDIINQELKQQVSAAGLILPRPYGPLLFVFNLVMHNYQGPSRQQAQHFEEPPYQYQQQHHRRDQPHRQEYSSTRVSSQHPHSTTHPHLKRPAMAASTYDGSPSAPKYAASAVGQSTIVRSNLRQIQCVDDPMSQQSTNQMWVRNNMWRKW